MTTPNLFSFATSELSQDAVLCWLLAWADPSRAGDGTLHDAGRAMLSAICAAAGREAPHPSASIVIRQQFERIDVVVEVGETLVLAIEDKTNTSDHAGQLERYSAALAQHYSGRQHARI